MAKKLTVTLAVELTIECLDFADARRSVSRVLDDGVSMNGVQADICNQDAINEYLGGDGQPVEVLSAVLK